jgi:hypothetical protein
MMMQRDEPTRTSRNTTRTFQDAERRLAELDHLANGCRVGSGVQHFAGLRPGTPYAHTDNTTPAPKITPMIYESEVLTDRCPAVAYNNNDVAQTMPTTITANDPEARGSQSPSQSIPARQQTRRAVKERVAAWEADIKRFGQGAMKGPEVFRVSHIDDVDDDGDSADWYQTNRHSPSSRGHITDSIKHNP